MPNTAPGPFFEDRSIRSHRFQSIALQVAYEIMSG